MPYTYGVKGAFLTQQINFIIAVCCVGSVVLLSSTAIMNAAEMDNPVVDAMVATGLADL